MSDLQRLLVCWGVSLLFGSLTLPAAVADPPSTRFHEVTAADGTPLNVVETGNVDAPALLLLHGFSQSYLSFYLQLHDPELTERFRVVAFDLRGHGGSGKPWLREAYAGHRLWADDVHRVIETLKLDKPVIVGWSFGGYVAMDYIREYGASSITALVLTGSHAGLIARSDGPRTRYVGDLDMAIRDAREFMQLMSAKPVSDDMRDRGTYAHVMMPAYVRNAMIDKRLDNTDMLTTLPVRTLVILGDQDASLPVIATKKILEANRNITVKTLSGVGHSAFIEDADSFNRELAQFVLDEKNARNTATTIPAH